MSIRNKQKRSIKKTRAHIRYLNVNRLTVHKSLNHMYAQVISPDNVVLAQASTLDKSLELTSTGNVDAAKRVGELLAQRCQENNISQVAFDRSGFKFHGRVKALADAARAGGLDF